MAAAGVLLLAASAATAKLEVGVEDWGLGGAVKSGLWSPLYVELKSTKEDFRGLIQVEAQAGQQVVPLFTKPILLVADTPTKHWLYFRVPSTMYRRSDMRLFWRLLDDRERTVVESEWRAANILPACDSVVAAVRTPGISATGIGGLVDTNSEVRTHALLPTASWLPDRAVGLASADALLWINPYPGALSEPGQRDAIVRYVKDGGRLVLAAGSGWQALTGSFLAELLPATPTGSRLAKALPALNAYEMPANAQTEIVLVDLIEPRGEVLMEFEGRPVIVRGRIGAGWVTLIGFDPTQEPFSLLGQRTRFWTDILGMEAPLVERDTVGSMTSASDPLIAALSSFPGLKPINFTFVGLFMLAYVILIGPVDYFVLKRLKKLHWTWVTFPGIAIVCSVMAFYVLSSGRVTGLNVNSLSLVDAAESADEISGNAYMVMFSPRQRRYEAAVVGGATGAVLPREYDVMGGGGPAGLSRSECIVLGAGARVFDLLVRVWDAQTFEACWHAPAPVLPIADLAFDGARLTGAIENPTPETLESPVVLFDGKAYPLSNIPPNGKGNLSGGDGRDLKTYTAGLMPRLFREGHAGWGHREFSTDREESDKTARWLSLFGASGKDADLRFRRWIQSPQEYRSGVFDLPANVQLSGLDSRVGAVLVYSTAETFAEITLEGETPILWCRSVVRLRTPVVRTNAN